MREQQGGEASFDSMARSERSCSLSTPLLESGYHLMWQTTAEV